MTKDEKRLKKEDKKRKKFEKKMAKRRLLVPANKKGKHIMPLLNFLKVLICPIQWLFYPYKLHGHKKVGSGAYIYFGNHYSMWDIVYPVRTTREGVHFIAKESVLRIPVVGAICRKLGVIGAQRDGSDVRTLMDSMKVLKNGEKLSLFPEGKRNRISEEEFQPFQGGAALLAVKTKTPVIPFVVCSRPRLFRRTHVVFGEPMELSEYYGRKMTDSDYAEAEEKLRNRLYELRDAYRASVRKKKGKSE